MELFLMEGNYICNRKLNVMDSPQEPDKTQRGAKGRVPFILATICATPFIIMAAFFAPTLLDNQQIPRGPLMASVVLLPLLLVLTFCELIFTILAWKRGPGCYKPFICGYWLANIAYWAVMVGSSPW
jgi:hypothetical protein